MKWFKRPLKPSQGALTLNPDAFSDGQVSSKIWLCGELERIYLENSKKPAVIWVFGGWYGILPFLLFSRERLQIEHIELFDIDPKAVQASLRINDPWRIRGNFSAYQHDVNDSKFPTQRRPDIVINTSCEHFSHQHWKNNVPASAILCVQSTNMKHAEHVSCMQSSAELEHASGPFSKVFFRNQLDFKYEAFQFSRFMVIGERKS